MNHSRCCANDNGNACSRAARSSAGIFRPPLFSLLSSSICFPSPATVGFSNRLLNPTSTPSTLLTRDTTCVASNECPPNSKKFSSLPTRSRFNTCAHTPATNSSVAVLAPPSPLPPSSCFPSPPSLPLPSPSSPSLLTTYATSRWSPSPSFSTTTTACPTPPCSPNTASISPNSIRYPLIFTCSSFLPKYSSSPPSLHLTRSPLRYSLLPPSSLYPCGTNRSAVCPAWFTYPRANPAPPIYNSPHTPSGTNSPSSSSTYTSTFAIGRPIGTQLCSPISHPLHHVLSMVISVGPYKFTTSTGLRSCSRLTNPAPSASPPQNNNRNARHCSTFPSSSIANWDGTNCTTVTCSRSIISVRYSASR